MGALRQARPHPPDVRHGLPARHEPAGARAPLDPGRRREVGPLHPRLRARDRLLRARRPRHPARALRRAGEARRARRPRGDAHRRGVPARARARHAAVGRHGHGHRPSADGDHRVSASARRSSSRWSSSPSAVSSAGRATASSRRGAAARTPTPADARRARTSARSRPVRARARSRTRARRSARRASTGRAPTRATRRSRGCPARSARGATAARRRASSRPADSRFASGRSPSPHMCIARWAGYSSPASQRSCASSASSPAARPPHHSTSAMSRSAGRLRHQMSVAASYGASAAASHVSACSKSDGRVVERAHRGERARVDAGDPPPSRMTDAASLAAALRRRLRTAARPRRPGARSAPATSSFSRGVGARELGARQLVADRRRERRPARPARSRARRAATRPAGQSAIEVRPPRVGRDAQGIDDAQATGIRSLLDRPREVGVRDPVVAEARVGVGDDGDGVGGGDLADHADERRCRAVDIARRATASGRSTRIAPRVRLPANGTRTRLRVGWKPSSRGTRDRNSAAFAAFTMVVMARAWGVARSPWDGIGATGDASRPREAALGRSPRAVADGGAAYPGAHG